MPPRQPPHGRLLLVEQLKFTLLPASKTRHRRGFHPIQTTPLQNAPAEQLDVGNVFHCADGSSVRTKAAM